jgi:hypothetical protein
MTNKVNAIKELKKIPCVGKSISEDLWDIGIRKIEDLKGQHPELLYDLSNIHAGIRQDRCLLYVYRCAVYFAETCESDREPSKLLWWNWKDRR